MFAPYRSRPPSIRADAGDYGVLRRLSSRVFARSCAEWACRIASPAALKSSSAYALVARARRSSA